PQASARRQGRRRSAARARDGGRRKRHLQRARHPLLQPADVAAEGKRRARCRPEAGGGVGMSVTGPQGLDPSAQNHSDRPPRVYFRGLATFLGILTAPPALFVVVVAAGGGHGAYWLAKTLFPWTMMSTAWTRTIAQPYVALAIAQYPLYGIVLDMARARGRFMP